MDKRLIYRVVLKLLFLLSLTVLTIVFVSSLFTKSGESNQKASLSVVELDVSGMRKGEIRKTQWEGKQVNVLQLKDKQYFIYTNIGDSGNCPLFKEVNGLKDICTGTQFDFLGRQKGFEELGVKLEVPPSLLKNGILFIGSE